MYFKINWAQDYINHDPSKQNKKTGIIITHGFNCGDSCNCNCANSCKYRSRFTYHNFSVHIRRFFEYKLHIKLPHLLYIQREYRKLSGTELCPFCKSRYYTCYDCVYYGGYDSSCKNEEYRLDNDWKSCHDFVDPDWGDSGRCKHFKKSKYADNYSTKDGEISYN